MNRTALLSVIATIIGITNFTGYSSVEARDSVSRPYEWTVEISTEQVPKQFQYQGSSLTKVVKTQIQYYPIDNTSNKTAYEDLWYSNAKPIGLERHNKLDMKQGDAVAIRVLHKAPGTAPLDEQRSAGKAVMKAIVDSNINKNMVATIKVPMDSFHTIESEIQNYHFSPAPSGGGENPISSDMNLFLESEPAGLTQSFVHYH